MDRRGLDKAARVLEHCSIKGSNGKAQGVASARELDERDGRREGGPPQGQRPLPPESPTWYPPSCQTTSAPAALVVTVTREEALLGLKHNVHELVVINAEGLESLSRISEILP